MLQTAKEFNAEDDRQRPWQGAPTQPGGPPPPWLRPRLLLQLLLRRQSLDAPAISAPAAAAASATTALASAGQVGEVVYKPFAAHYRRLDSIQPPHRAAADADDANHVADAPAAAAAAAAGNEEFIEETDEVIEACRLRSLKRAADALNRDTSGVKLPRKS